MSGQRSEVQLPASGAEAHRPEGEPDPFDDLAADAAPAKPLGPDWLRRPGAWGRRRPTWATAVALIFVLNAFSQMLYASLLPLLPPLLPDPVPWVGLLLGAVSLGTAFGIFRGSEWGRWLGIALAVSSLARNAAFVEAWLRSPNERGGPNLVIDILLPMAINGLILGLLLFRWPRR